MNKTRAVWLMLLFVSTALLGGYFFFRHKTQEQRQFLFSMKQKCQQAGERLYQEDIKSAEEGMLLVPEYGYNAELNTCLYAGGLIKQNWINRWVKDSFANKEIISLMLLDEKSVDSAYCKTCLSSEEFNRQKEELFSENQ